MNCRKTILFFLSLMFGGLTVNAQDCQSLDLTEATKEREAIPGETMGQKLESLLFWSQAEKNRRFPMMQAIYPSIQISKGKEIISFEKLKNLTPKWADKTTLSSYMKDNHVKGIIVVQNNQIRLEE